MARSGRWITRDDRGASAVEFALVLPILLAIVLGIILFGFVFASQINLNTAARDAARAGVVEPLSGTGMDCGAIAQMAQNNARPLGGSSKSVGVEVRDYNDTPICKISAGTSVLTPDSDSTAHPCAASNTTTAPLLTVTLTYVVTVPFEVPYLPGSSKQPLEAKGSFQCEYS